MLQLSDNLFNKSQSRNEPKLKVWRYAGLLLTYRCNAACRFCYYRCSPSAAGLMTVETAIKAWQGLERLAGPQARVHLTGGEPFLYFDRLLEICTEARRLGLQPAESIETNAGWLDGQSDKDVLEKLDLLRACAIEKLKISWDPFHEEFINIEHVLRLVRLSKQMLGPDRVLVRWQKHLDNPSGIKGLSKEAGLSVLKDALKTDPCRFTGRASELLADLADGSPVANFKDRNCRSAIMDAKGIHIDPDGNTFVGQCSGMIVGNVQSAGLDELWSSFEPNKMDFWTVLFNNGPAGFLSSAVQMGYSIKSVYASKCHLCTDLRCFFFDKRRYSTIIGPIACYPITDKKGT